MFHYFKLLLVILFILGIYILFQYKDKYMIHVFIGFIGLYITTKEDLLESFQPSMKNVYGETLQPCRKYSDDPNGSWDDKGLCSELGGGVHQICFDVTKQTQNFATDTYQGMNWSKDRLGKNHCMCLGAWGSV